MVDTKRITEFGTSVWNSLSSPEQRVYLSYREAGITKFTRDICTILLILPDTLDESTIVSLAKEITKVHKPILDYWSEKV